MSMSLGQQRFVETLEKLNSEYQLLTRDVNMYKSQREEYERKLLLQVQEVQSIKASIFELECKQNSLQKKYEDELLKFQKVYPQQDKTEIDLRLEEKTNGGFQLPKVQDIAPTALPPVSREKDKIDFSSSSSQNIKVESFVKQEIQAHPRADVSASLMSDLNHQSVVCCVKFSQDGKYLATGSNRKAQIFSAESGALLKTYTDPSWVGDLYLRSVCFSPDGKYLACGAEDKTVKLWDIEKETVTNTFSGHQMDIYSLDYSQDGRFIASASGDKKVRIWDVEKRECAWTLGTDAIGPKDGVTSVAISPDGRLVAAGSLDRIIRLWDISTGYFLERFEGHTDSVYSVTFSPDGKSLASGSLDKTIRIWDFADRQTRTKCRTAYEGHTDFVLSVAYTIDGSWLLSGSKDRTVRFWDVRASTYTSFEGHKNSVISVATNPTEKVFATGSGDQKAKLWRYNIAH